jgi:hypothetical protein
MMAMRYVLAEQIQQRSSIWVRHQSTTPSFSAVHMML